MKIQITSLKEVERVFEFESDNEIFRIDELMPGGTVITTATVDKVGSQINIAANVKGKFLLECDRCIENFVSDFSIDFTLIVKFDFTGEFMGKDSEDENLKFISPGTHYIDLFEDVRDYIILAIPMRKVPEDKDGYCSFCSRNLSEMYRNSSEEDVNPVWEKLIEKRKN